MSLEIVREQRVLRIALQAPEQRNVLTQGMLEDLLAALASPPPADVLLLHAHGPLFCGGLDPSAADPAALRRTWALALHALRALPVPLVGVAQGPALGAGVALLACCHLALAAQGCSFALPEVRAGDWPTEAFPVLAAALGERRARALALSGRVFSAPEALHFGLVHELAPAIELEDRADDTVRVLLSHPPSGLRQALPPGR